MTRNTKDTHPVTGICLLETAQPLNVFTLEDPGTKALAEVETVIATANTARVFFMVNILDCIT